MHSWIDGWCLEEHRSSVMDVINEFLETCRNMFELCRMQPADIQTRADIEILVNTFYGKVQADDTIGPIFERVVNGNWAPHLDKMYRFWETVLLEEHSYFGGPFPPHARLPIEQVHFDRWLAIWRETIDQLFMGEKADEAKWRAEKMATMFMSKLNWYREHGGKPLL